MITGTFADQALTVAGDAGGLSISSQRTAKADALYVRIVNQGTASASVAINIQNWSPSSTVTQWTLTSATQNGGNSAASPNAVAPVQTSITLANGASVTVPAASFTVLGYTAA